MGMEKYIAVVRRGQVLRLAVDNIIYIMKVGRKVRIVSTDGQWEYYERMENLLPFLDSRFYVCLRVLAVNLERVEKMENQTIFFQNGESYRLGRDNYVRVRQQYAARLKHLI